jgi:hypothetical protein
VIFDYLIGTTSGDADATPVTKQTAQDASVFYYNMSLIENTEYVVEYDGSICLDWTTEDDARFSMSVNGSGNVSWAWVFGTASAHGFTPYKDLTSDWYQGMYKSITS